MCPHHSENKNNFEFIKELDNKFMSIEIVKKIYKKFPEAYLVMLGGVGEPLLNPEFKEIVKLTAKNKKKMNLITNGILLNEDMSNFILSEKYFNQISISLNAPNQEVYSSICGVSADTFEDVIKNIKYIVRKKKELKSDIEIILSGVCGQEFVKESKEFLKLCDTLGVDRIDLHRYIDFNINEGLADIDDSSYNINDLYDFSKTLHTKINLPHKLSKYEFNCNWYFKNLSFDSKGNIGSCGRVINPNKEYGNINDEEDIWNNEYMRDVRELIINKQVPSKYCIKCVENYEVET